MKTNVSDNQKNNFTNDLNRCIEVLRQGGIILYPTDSVWGIGCDATNAQAVKRIYDIKQRNDSKSMLVLIDSEAKLPTYVQQVPETAWKLLDVTDKPLTLIYPGARNLAENLIAPDGSIGIRITSEAFSKTLCERFRKPIVSTSANISGEPTPYNFKEISENIKQQTDYIVVSRQTEKTKTQPSSIIKIESDGTIKIIRT